MSVPDEVLSMFEELGGYRPERELGRGATGTVYLAASPAGEWVAVKRVPEAAPTDEVGVGLLRREVGRIVSLAHPNLVRVLDVIVAGKDVCVVMEYVHGLNLRSVLGIQEPSHEQVVHWVTGIADALDFLHGLGIVHRDVKPSNVLIEQSGEARLADLLDLSALAGSPGRGTPAYMAPEMARGDRSVDGRVDVYSLACIAYEALTGRPPFVFDPDRPEDALRAHIRDVPLDPSQLSPQFPRPIALALLTGLEKDPASRPPTPGHFAAALAEAIATPDSPVPDPGPVAAGIGLSYGGMAAAPVDPDRTLVAPLSSPLKAHTLAPPSAPAIDHGGRSWWLPVLLITLAVIGAIATVVAVAAFFHIGNPLGRQ
jgi:serine/threonine-protein kinase